MLKCNKTYLHISCIKMFLNILKYTKMYENVIDYVKVS